MGTLLKKLTLLAMLAVVSCQPAITTPEAGRSPSNSAIPKSSSGLLRPNTTYSQNIRFEQLSLEEGLSQSVVTAILQDQAGFLWIGTEDGLNRYDGYTFKVFKPDEDDPASLSDRWITSLAEDANGQIWIGTRFGGANRYDPVSGNFTRILPDETNPQGLSNSRITALLVDGSSLWIGTENGLDRLDLATGVFSHHRSRSEDPNSLSSNSITTLFQDSQGILWIGMYNAGLNSYDPFTNTYRAYKFNENDPASLSHNHVLSIAEDTNGRIWVGTGNGLNRLEPSGSSFRRFMNSPGEKGSLGGNLVYAVYKDRSGGLWLGTNHGLDRYDFQTNTFIHHRHQPTVGNSLSNNTVYDIYEDRSGVLWVGSYGGGINKYNRQQDKFTYYRNNPDDPNSLSGDLIFPILVDMQGIVWIGVHGGGLNRFDPKSGWFTQYRHDPSNPNSLDSDDLIALEADSAGRIWIGTQHGLNQYDPKTGNFTRYQPDAGVSNLLSGSPVIAIHEDRQGNLWTGTGRGLYLFDATTQSFINYRLDSSDESVINFNSVSAILDDSQGNLWVGTTDDGLKRISISSTSVEEYHKDLADPTSLGSDSILCLIRDSHGNLWVGTNGGGLNLYLPQTDSFKRYTEKNGLPNEVIYGILEDEFGHLWLSTNFGLSRFDPLRETFRNYTASDGLQSNEFNQNAFASDREGNLYFGGINGLNVFAPRDVLDDPLPPALVLTSLSQDGSAMSLDRTVETVQEVMLVWPQDSFEFEFAALAFGQPNKNQYSYFLENFDSNWVFNGNKRTGRYTNLPGGAYTLRLRGSNSDGTWNESGTSIKVTVVPPFWETWWFQVLALAALAASIAGGLRWRVKSVEARNRELERLVSRRTADLEKRSREIEALYEADERILRNVTLNQVCQTLVDVSVSLLKADRSAVFVWNDQHTRILPRVSHGFLPRTLNAFDYEAHKKLVEQSLMSGKPVTLQNGEISRLDPAIQSMLTEEGILSMAHFPIEVDGKVVAIFDVGYTRPNALTEDIVRLYTALVQRASLSIANMQLFEQTKDLAVMEERNRLARDLHDSAKQKAFAALAQLGTANGMWKARSDAIQPHLSEAETLIYEVIQELTFLIQEIYPIALQDKGLLTTLREYIYEWENRNDAVVDLSVCEERSLPLETEQAIYRVIQEALANVSRHSRATRVEVSLAYAPESLLVHITDNGSGFDLDQKAKGMGIRSMRERIGSIHGTVQIHSAPGQGTRVIVQVPLEVPEGVERT